MIGILSNISVEADVSSVMARAMLGPARAAHGAEDTYRGYRVGVGPRTQSQSLSRLIVFTPNTPIQPLSTTVPTTYLQSAVLQPLSKRTST